jgi:hypothetical protein
VILECETIAQTPEHDQDDDFARILGPVLHAAPRSLTCRPQSRRRKRRCPYAVRQV